MYCPECGTKLTDNMKFCPNCGQTIKPLDMEIRTETPPPEAQKRTDNEPQPQGKYQPLKAILYLALFIGWLFLAYKLTRNALNINFFSFP